VYFTSSDAHIANLEPLMRKTSSSNNLLSYFSNANKLDNNVNDGIQYTPVSSSTKINILSTQFNGEKTSNFTKSKNKYQNLKLKLESTQKIWDEPRPTWLRISDDLYLYSAFWDPRDLVEGGPVARVLGIIRYNKDMMVKEYGVRKTGFIKDDWLPYSCYLWYKSHRTVGQLKAFMFEEGLKAYVGTYFLCYPTNNTDNTTKQIDASETPYAVSIFPKNVTDYPNKIIYLINNYKESKGNLINVHNILVNRTSVKSDNSSFINADVSVCVRALFGPYDDIQGMVQFISYYNIILGIKHFYFYELAVSSRVRKWFSILKNFDIHVHLLPWNLPTGNWEELWDFGSLTAINDCNYRSAGRHKFTIFVDLDEFLVPKAEIKSIHHMYQQILKHKRGTFGDTALIPNVFFCEEFEDFQNNKESIDEQQKNATKGEDIFPIFKYTKREGRLWPPKVRSKMIVVPDTVISVGHHMVHHFVKKDFSNRASPKLFSALHHYRSCEGLRHGIHATGSKVLDTTTVNDKSIFKFKSKVMGSALVQSYKLMKEI
ncbi:unnamed protein product, partial [Meganyctiphanes norvegica]